MSLVLHLVLAPDNQKADVEGIPQIQIDQLRTIFNYIYKINNEKPLHPDNDLTDDEIVFVIMGQQVMKGIGQNHTPPERKYNKKQIGMNG
eukprot:7056752-Ditylum_brightwellii.AAC.1